MRERGDFQIFHEPFGQAYYLSEDRLSGGDFKKTLESYCRWRHDFKCDPWLGDQP